MPPGKRQRATAAAPGCSSGAAAAGGSGGNARMLSVCVADAAASSPSPPSAPMNWGPLAVHAPALGPKQQGPPGAAQQATGSSIASQQQGVTPPAPGACQVEIIRPACAKKTPPAAANARGKAACGQQAAAGAADPVAGPAPSGQADSDAPAEAAACGGRVHTAPKQRQAAVNEGLGGGSSDSTAEQVRARSKAPAGRAGKRARQPKRAAAEPLAGGADRGVGKASATAGRGAAPIAEAALAAGVAGSSGAQTVLTALVEARASVGGSGGSSVYPAFTVNADRAAVMVAMAELVASSGIATAAPPKRCVMGAAGVEYC